MQQREVEIINKLGLHARAAAKLTQLAAKYQCDISLARNGRKVNAKSIMGVMMLAAGKGSRVVLETDCHRRTDRRLLRRRGVMSGPQARNHWRGAAING